MVRVAKAFTLALLVLVTASCARPTVSAQRDDVETLPTLGAVLQRNIPVRFRRAHLSEVLSQLRDRVGLDSAFPKPADKTFTFDLEARGVAVDDVLKQLAEAGGLELEFRDRTAVFWKKADDEELRSLEKTAKATEPTSGRCEALRRLAGLGDPRIYPTLFWAMAKGSEPMALLAARQLDELHADTLRFAQDHGLFAEGLRRLFEFRPELELQQLMGLAAASRSPQCGELLLPLLERETLQAYVVHCLGETRDPRTVGALLELLRTAKPSDPNNDTGQPPADREQIISVLGQIGTPQGIRELRKLAQQEENPYFRLNLASALFAAGDERGFDMLKVLLEESAAAEGKAVEPAAAGAGGGGAFGGGMPGPPAPFRADVVGTMARSRDARAVEPIIGVLTDPRPEVLREAIQQLGELRDARAVAPLLALLAKPKLQQVTIGALQKIGDARATEPIAKLVDDAPTPDARYAAALYLLIAGDERGPAAVWQTYRDLEPQFHHYAFRALAHAGDQKALDTLVAHLEPDGTRRPRDAADALAVLREIKTVPALERALRIDNVDASFAAASAISAMRHPKATDHAIALLSHEEPKVRQWGARILEWIGDPKATDTLIGALKDGDALVRQYASAALVTIGDDRAVDAALAMLKDPARDVRRYTAQGLGEVGGPKVVEALFDSLGDSDSFVREAAAKALLATHDRGAIRRLAMLASGDSSDAPGYTAQRAFYPPANFAWLHRVDPCVMDELILLMGDEDSEVRVKAALALAVMSDPCAIPPLAAALQDRSESVRSTARNALVYFSQDERAKAALLGIEK